jgi:ribosomal-protein-alanine N-acetyltransferase
LTRLVDRVDDGVVALRRVEATDAAAFAAPFAEDRGLALRLGLARPWTEQSVIDGLAAEQAARDEESWARWAVARSRDDAFAGAVIVRDIDARHRRAEVGIWLVPAARGEGAGVRALELVARIVFGHLGFERLWLRTEASNAAMRTLAARAGFREEGVLRAHDRLPDGTRADLVVAGRLSTD